MSQKYLIRIAELERLLSKQAEALRQKDQQLSAKWHLNRSQFGIRIDHDLASISDHSLASQSITIWHASDH
ncbi:hypothetical protein YE25_23210 [Salmonella enterica subsp. enterica serovar Enteritidis]|nr:hypothetical protein [Salmonella enterica subsp. enterica serovar Enteritidis]EDS4008115.1 hypothetical protein [Salmonella enterica subsp. enterica]EDW4264958.1 hypothetical protein [Salmonella enterica subsp. enterica serovar Sinstorf]EEJ8921181.1 hypothetical protein [Salmonella enterica subsp. enterica]